MPIIEPVDPASPLSQGDVLSGLRLYLTKGGWREGGGEASGTDHRLCIVISRHCVAGHKLNVTVAAIEKYKDAVPGDVEDFEDAVNFLTDMRDGVGSPDRFYLGQLPGEEGRFAARLDSLHTIQVPSKEEMSAFLAARRVAGLNVEFVRDFHLRVFQAFASLGFSDSGWLSIEDLRWLVLKGQRDISTIEGPLLEDRAKLQSGIAHGFPNAGERAKIEKEIAKHEKKYEKIKQNVEKYIHELESRES